MSEGGSPEDAKLPKKGCLGLYAAWAGLVALFVGFLWLTGAKDDAPGFGLVLLVLPGAIAAGLWWGERLLRRASERLGFPIRKLSRKDGQDFDPAFEAEVSDGEWFVTLLEGERDGMPVALYDRTGRSSRASRSPGRQALGVVWTLPGVRAPRLVVHGSACRKVLVLAHDASGRRADALSALPPVAPGAPVDGFEKRFNAFGEPGAEVLLTPGVQAALLGLPRRSRLLVERQRVRWELEREAPLSRGLGRRAEELLRITVPLRDALLEAASLLPRAD